MANKVENSSKATERSTGFAPSKLRPSEFMRARRPERFADSQVVEETKLTPAMFEYQLDTLTSRKQETEFEHFARRLAERELCPNLLPQTGPTGGGDSKVDAETYPVSEEISLRWYQGVGGKADKERWAFAFSAKKDWEGKIKGDVEKISQTGRNYALVYFITNQFVADKKRAAAEDALTKQFSMPVRILDRSWIMKSVFEHRHQDIAIETLHLTGYEKATRKELGPNDARREAELKKLDAQIDDPSRYLGVTYQLGEDCLSSALLARGLEFSRAEIEGRFARAERVAKKLGHPQQRLRIAYAKAWTAFWWFDDFDQLHALYDEVETLATGSDQADDLKLLANLWTVLTTSINAGELDLKVAKFDQRTSKLQAELDRLAKDGTRQNNALWARTTALLMDLQLSLSDAARLSAVLGELGKVLESAGGLVSYPIEPVTKIIRELGNVLTDNRQYDDLLERVVAITEARASRGEAGRVLLERGFQKLTGKKPYEAIVIFGRAQQLLALREYRDELIAALQGAGLAYESAGLLWAARANTLAAANQAVSEYVEEGTVTRELLMCLQKLVWLELQLGRVPASLQWIEAASVIAQHAGLSDEGKERYADQRSMQDGVLAILLLKTDVSTLKWLGWLPSLFDEYGLTGSWMALLYSLGYEDHLRSEGAIPPKETAKDVREVFVKWQEQPAAEDVPEVPDFYLESRVTLRSSVLGCALAAYAKNDLSSIALGERILASLEALLATSLEGALPHVENFTINIKVSDFVQGQPEWEFDEVGQAVTVTHAISNDISPDGTWLQDLLVNIVARIVMIKDLQSYGERVLGQESGFARAINFSEAIVPLKNIVGNAPKFRISDWENTSTKALFPLRRTSEWNKDLKKQIPKASGHEFKPGEGAPPSDLLDFSNLKHKERKVLSLINISLWDRAGWTATIYGFVPDSNQPPILGLAFKDASAGKSIFEAWKNRLGKIDDQERLRISIIRGIDALHPHGYRVVIGSNLSVISTETNTSQMVLVSRINRMHPKNSDNLDGFLSRFKSAGRYLLAPARFDTETPAPDLFLDFNIEKKQLTVRQAWEIGPNDPDSIAIEPDDNPIIPAGTLDVPVVKLLAKKRSK
jgi:hypothetical protein